jgi:ribose transport system substrate-binding protein
MRKRRSVRLAGTAVLAAALGLLLLTGCGGDEGGGGGGEGGGGGGQKKVKIGVIQITLAHGYQKILNDGYKAKAKELGADLAVCINDLDPSKDVRCGEDLISGGADVIINAPADPGSFAAVVRLAKAQNIPVVNDGSPQPIQKGVVPFTGTDSIGGGEIAGRFAVDWIKKNLGGKAQVAELTLPTFTDCVNRNKGFDRSISKLQGAPVVARANGSGLRAKALPAMENMLQGQPGINVVFGCNDDSALGALSALQGKNKDPKKTLVIGFDGTEEAFKEIKKGGMFRADIVQRPDCYSRRMMEIAVKIARGEEKVDKYVDEGYYFVKTPIVTNDNVDEWLKWKGTPETAPEECVLATHEQK